MSSAPSETSITTAKGIEAVDNWQQGRTAFGRGFGGPGKYIRRAGEIERLPDHLKSLGAKAFFLVDGFVLDSIGASLRTSLEASGLPHAIERFGGECCAEEIARIGGLARAARADIVVGVGGGKTADTSKVAACANGARLAVVPTIASTDAPCSAIAVRYSPQGVYQESMFLPRNPDIVIVDSAVVAKAPARFLVAGVGDALSTWFEARSNLETRSNNLIGAGFSTPIVGRAIAKACQETLLRDALAAKLAIERGALTEAVENIIEANTLLSGLGFENCGVSGGHGIQDGLTVLHQAHGFFHGEKVAFGTLCLLMLEGRPLSEIDAMVKFCRSLGLPTTLADLNLADATKADIGRVAEASLTPDSATWRSAAPLSVDTVRDAILALDAYSSGLNAAVV
jgi:glycerol dehydrogenase